MGMLNLHSIVQYVDEAIVAVGSSANREPELKAFIECLIAGKRLLDAYSKRTENTPFKDALTVSEVNDDLYGTSAPIMSYRHVQAARNYNKAHGVKFDKQIKNTIKSYNRKRKIR
jgi:hypothetical protein